MPSPRPRSRFRAIFAAHLGRVKGGLTVAALCTVGGTLTELAKPWPLKVIIDYGLLQRPLPHRLSLLQPVMDRGAITLIVVAAASIVAISILAGAFSYFQIYITSSIGYRTVYALR